MYLRPNIFVEYRLDIILYCLGSDNNLIMVGDLFELPLRTNLDIMKKCYKTIKNILQLIVYENFIFI